MNMRASLVIKAKDEASGPLGHIAAATRRLGDNARRMAAVGSVASAGLDRVRNSASSLTSKLRVASVASVRLSGRMGLMALEKAAYGVGTAIGFSIRTLASFAATAAQIGVGMAPAAAAFVVTDIIRTGSQFEQFDAQLRNMTGSASAAKQSLDWVQKFAQATPFELEEVTRAFVTMKQRMMEPMDGSLRVLGDAAAALNTPIGEAVEMMADAMTFQFERLRAYGITASQQGEKVALNWVKNGKAMTQTVRKDAVAIKTALMGILQGNYGGAMAAQSGTLNGIISNLKDKWKGFMKMIADAGIYVKVKKVMADLLAWADKMSANGKLKAWAKAISDELGFMFDKAVTFVKEVDWGAVARGIGTIVAVMVKVVEWIGKAASAWSNWQSDVQRRADQAVVNAPGTVSVGGVRLWGVTEDERREARSRLGGLPKSRVPRRAPSLGGQGPLKQGERPVAIPGWGQGWHAPLKRDAQPVPSLSGGSSRKAASNTSQLDGKVKIEMTVKAEPGVKVRTTQLTSSNPRVPVSVRTGRAMAGPA